MDDSQKLDRILEILEGSRSLKPYELPPIAADQAKMDRSINIDGSAWTNAPDFSPGGDTGGTPVRIEYGYYSEKKNPGLWAWLNTQGDQGQEFIAAATTNPYMRYRGDPDAFLRTGQPNWITFGQFIGVDIGTYVPPGY